MNDLTEATRRLGLSLPAPAICDQVTLDQLEEVFIQASKPGDQGADFILYMDNKEQNSHGCLKLYESKYKASCFFNTIH